jgi:hypothetical protein
MSKTPEEREAHERFLVYMRGWRHGACMKAMDPTLAHHQKYGQTYDQGYADGHKSRSDASQRAAKRFGYTPSILRLCDE